MSEQIKKIQSYLKDNGHDALVVFTNDDHGSEYVVDHFKFRAYLSSFTGSAGTLVITKEKALLWTDGRYFLQAASQLSGTGIELMKSGEPGVPTVTEYLASLSASLSLVTDFRLTTVSFVKRLHEKAPNAVLVDNQTLEDEIWTQRPPMRATRAWILPLSSCGESVTSKLQRVRTELANTGCNAMLVASLDDIAWLYNLRGDDIPYNPVNYAYSLLTQDRAILYMDAAKTDAKVRKYLASNGIELRPYDDIYKDAQAFDGEILIDEDKTNYALCRLIKKYRSASSSFPTTALKAIKNATEIHNLKKAHIEDAVAMVKFIHYVKTYAGREPMTEISLADKLESFRKEGKHFLDLSFDTICGYKEHGAIVHYSSTKETDVPVTNAGLLLVDSGAQYLTGTTDITRTIAAGKLSKDEKTAFTLVLKGHIDLAQAVFPEGTTGRVLDILARQPLYRRRLDYKHGTGHGVGYLLNVHEGPQSISMRGTGSAMKAGMVTSDEPGLYIENHYGIRHENLVLCVPAGQSEYGRFLAFEPLTFVPFDLDGIDKKLLSKEQIEWLNRYHSQVYKKVSPYLTPRLKKFLARQTRPI